MAERQRMILDVDTGLDDAVALALAVNLPDAEVVAVTTVAGNVDVERATRNTLNVLDAVGATDVPVHRGSSRPLVRTHRHASYAHGEDGLGGVSLPESGRAIGADRGPAAIIRLASAHPGDLTLVTLGALTNLAIALNVEPGLPDLLRRVVVMGGAYHVPGNVTPAAEFNVWEDPEAAAQVFAAPFKELIAVGLDVTNHVRLDASAIAALDRRSDLSPAARLVRDLGHSPMWHGWSSKLALHDPIAVAAAYDPTLFTYESAAIRVETEGETSGKTVVIGEGPVRVAIGIDEERFFRLFNECLGLAAADDVRRV